VRTVTTDERHVDLDRLRRTGAELVSLTSGATDDALRRRADAREWSAAEILAHLADAELVYATRLRLIVTQDRPRLVSYDERSWVQRFAALDEKPKSTLERWRTLREANVALLRSLQDDEWHRVGLHDDGELSVDDIARRMADHDRAHLDQLRRAVSS
jgi:hypothetical protein